MHKRRAVLFLRAAWTMDQFGTHGVQGHTKAMVAMVMIAISVLQQGCLAAAWVAAVGADSMRAGDVRFHAFEETWVSTHASTTLVDHPPLTSLALMPVEGDEAMGDRLTKVLLRETALRVVTPEKRHGRLSGPAADDTRAVLARELTREFAVDAVLYGHVVDAASRSSEWGWTAEQPRRLFLYMIDRDGQLLWKDELPFLVVTGTKPPLEKSIQMSLTRHFMGHVRDLGLVDVGYFPSKSF